MYAEVHLRASANGLRRLGIECVALIILTAVLATAAPAHAGDLDKDLDGEIAELKADVAALSESLFELEETVLHPADTQVAIFLTLDRKDVLELDSVELFINDTPVASHLYSERERASLQEGGVQKLYLGNLPHGEHQLRAVLTARSANERFVRREASHRFQKRPGTSRIQMTLGANAPDYEPVVAFREWN